MGTSPPVRVHPDACGSGSRPVANFLFARSGLWMSLLSAQLKP